MRILCTPRPTYRSTSRVDISTDTRPMYRSTYRLSAYRYVGRHIGRGVGRYVNRNVSVDVSTDVSTEISAKWWSTYRPTIGRYLGRYSGRHSTDTLNIDCRRTIGSTVGGISVKSLDCISLYSFHPFGQPQKFLKASCLAFMCCKFSRYLSKTLEWNNCQIHKIQLTGKWIRMAKDNKVLV